MATRSRIGIQFSGSVLSSYHHWDGYPEWLGRILEAYNTKEKVADLIDGGDMSCWSDEVWGNSFHRVNMVPSIILLAAKLPSSL